METKIVSYTPETLPRLTEERRASLRALAALPDSEIDLSDIPGVDGSSNGRWAYVGDSTGH